MRLRSPVGLALLLTAACSGIPGPPPPTNPGRILLINDVYVADTLADGTGGLARVAELNRRIRTEGPVLFVLAGDVLSPSLLSKYYQGKQMVDVLNAAGLDYATFGNHEFELDRDTLVARIAESRFKWLSANCLERNGQPFPGVLAWDTVRKAGRLVGLYGLTLQGNYRSYVNCVDPDSAATIAVDTLSKMGVDLILALTHQTVSADVQMLSREGRLDAVLGGHEHEAHTVAVGGRFVLKADANARSVQFLNVWGGKGNWREVPRLLNVGRQIPLDTAVQRIVSAWGDSLKARLGPDRVVGKLTVRFEARDAIQRRQETELGDFVSDAVRLGTGADVALVNSGLLRIDDEIHPGPITRWFVEGLFLFPDESRFITFPVTGKRLREILETGVNERNYGRGGFLQVSGVRFTVDTTQPSGSRIGGPALDPAARPIEDARVLKVAMPIYVACQGGDNFSIPEAQEACAKASEAPRAADLVLRHITQQPEGAVGHPEGGRITVK